MSWLVLLFWINFVFSQTSKDVPVEVSENEDLLTSLEELMKESKDDDLEARMDTDEDDFPRPEVRMSSFGAEFPPPKNIKDLSEPFAMNFLNYAAASYCNKDEIERWDCYNCQGFGKNTKEIVYVSYAEHNSAAFFGVNHERKLIIVSYRGTSNFKNWLINLDFKLVGLRTNQTSAIKVHSGFNNAADALMPKIRSSLLMAKKQNPKYKIVFTGHSLGGAIATLAAAKLAEERAIEWSDIQLITFGQPRVGNSRFADYLNSKPIESARVTTKGDIVAISPGRTLKYYHSQHIVHMNLNGESIKCSTTKEDRACTHYLKSLSLSAHFTFKNQRINSNCVDPKTVDPRNWFQKARDNTAEWFKNAKKSTADWFKKTWSKWF
ncbi:alpha/beta-hydrolase [Conidiobolus coronatus NRRL 28638]|uniref:Alpha/beta-hydrolase n=1 Tax=Conidiobolus coronatus (strain ATCC 28846 / CBS 209.66 / NRRL 28638) TaxID=796925 RepID=A0A137PHK3_CONC2|nr:alpha/beta-hydrolase [Conidiobolus coronatus NRRL 28638]|eukprot:KXN74483.1 alpha/beta-hydrolase [Conidiobolus coronatus NRRL 28638]